MIKAVNNTVTPKYSKQISTILVLQVQKYLLYKLQVFHDALVRQADLTYYSYYVEWSSSDRYLTMCIFYCFMKYAARQRHV